MDSKNIKYIVLTILLLILSVFGVISIFKINPSPLSVFSSSISPTPSPSPIPTPEIEVQEVDIPVVETPQVEDQVIEITPEVSITIKPTIVPTKKPTPTPTSIPTPRPTKAPTPQPTSSIPTVLTFTNPSNNFSINYLSNRKVYSGIEDFGDRYTFSNTLGNFAVHVTRSGTWTWINPNRTFSSSLTVAGKSTYRYDIATQTIVDLQTATKNYTIQCVHNGRNALKVECEEFIKSFTFLQPETQSTTQAETQSESQAEPNTGSEQL